MPPFLVTFFAKPIAKYLGIAVVSLVLLGGFYIKGRNDGYNLVSGQLAAQQLEWQGKVNDLQLKHQREADFAASQYDADVKVLQVQIDKLKKNPRIITKYVPVKVDSLAPNGLVTLHDRAAAGKDLDDDVENAEGDSSVRLSVFGSTVASNYNSCAQDRRRLKALQDVVKSYQERQKELLK